MNSLSGSFMSRTQLLHADVTETVIGCFYHVYNTLGYGFLEKVYENALKISLAKAGLTVLQQAPISVGSE